MKKIAMTMAAAGLLMVCGGCAKEHQCKCETTDVPDDGTLKVFVLEGSISCEDIKEMAIEKHSASNSEHPLRRVDVHKVKCRSYGK